MAPTGGLALEREARRVVPQLLGEYLEQPPSQIRVRKSPGRGADLTIKAGRNGPLLVCEVIASSRVAAVRQAARQVLAASETIGGEPVLVVPHMGDAGARVAHEEGVSYVDLSGNMRLRWHDLLARVEGRPNLYPDKGRPASPFAPRSARVSRLLLIDTRRWWQQAELAREGRLGSGQVSKVIGRLAEDGLLEVDDRRRVRASNPAELLDAWSAEYSYDRHEIVRGHLSGAGAKLTRQLAQHLDGEGVRFAFTGLPAAWLMQSFARFRLISVYVDGDPLELADQVGMRVQPRGANVHLVGPNDDGVFDGGEEIQGLPCVSAIQTYLDLLDLPERAPEAAKQLRSKRLPVRRRR